MKMRAATPSSSPSASKNMVDERDNDFDYYRAFEAEWKRAEKKKTEPSGDTMVEAKEALEESDDEMKLGWKLEGEEDEMDDDGGYESEDMDMSD